MDINWIQQCDKFTDHSYLSLYKFLINNNPKNVLEIGVRLGAPFYYWKDIFNINDITGIDNRTLEQASKEDGLPFLPVPSWGTFIHSTVETVDISTLPSFDLIVDDGRHWAVDQAFALNKFYKKLSKNGLMIIEDVKSLQDANFVVDNFVGDKDKLMIIDRRFVKGREDDIIITYYNT